MTLKEIADELVAGCREERTRENLDKLYAADAVSVEPTDMGGGRETVGAVGRVPVARASGRAPGAWGRPQ